ncbi:MAG: peptide chain release factor N(5)-glutamine methyltransferase [Lachnospiraceae bacterium]|nr:peptide chain release factor N(5)-glutamine methyltransferase [Lachnospiraceae bacterium]
MTCEEAYRKGAALLKKAGVAEYTLDARLLLEHFCGVSRQELLVHGDRELAESKEQVYFQAVGRREKRVPLQQITGMQEFMGLPFYVDENVLIPRQDTETLVEEALKVLKPGMEILDLCTGSSCILLSLLYYSEGCEGLGTDISAGALTVAERNLDRIQTLYSLREEGKTDRKSCEEKAPDRKICEGKSADREIHEGKLLHAALKQSNLFASVAGRFDVIVSNPPYIASQVMEDLEPEVKVHEPALALDGGEDGLNYYRRIIPESREHFKDGGCRFLELGYAQGAAVSGLMSATGFEDVRVIRDLAGLDRVVTGKWGRTEA